MIDGILYERKGRLLVQPLWLFLVLYLLLAHLKTWEISNANSPNKKKLCFGALTRPIKGKRVKFTRHSVVDGTCAKAMKAKRKQIGGWKENYEIKLQIYGTTFSSQQALNCTHYCHCVALSIPWHCTVTCWKHDLQFQQHELIFHNITSQLISSPAQVH